MLECWNFINVDMNGRVLLFKTSLETIESHMVSLSDSVHYNSFPVISRTQEQSRHILQQSSLMLALRTRTLRGIRTDFGSMYTDKPDSKAHLLTCSVLQQTVPAGPTVVQYGDVFSQCQETQNIAVLMSSQLVKTREGLLEQNV